MGCIRIAFIIFSLVIMSNTPDEEITFFTTRIIFFGMLLLDYVNIKRFAHTKYEKFVGYFGIITFGVFVFFDAMGLFNFMHFDQDAKFLIANNANLLMGYFGPIKLDTYLIFTTIFTMVVSFFELGYNMKRDYKLIIKEVATQKKAS